MERLVVAVVWSVTKASAMETPAETLSPAPELAPVEVEARLVWVAVAEKAPPSVSTSFAASGVPTSAVVVLASTVMATEGLIDADPPEEPESAFVLTVSTESGSECQIVGSRSVAHCPRVRPAWCCCR